MQPIESPGLTDAWPPGVWFADEIDSTNAEALRRPREGLTDGACLVAGEQTAGRGRRGRRWSATRDHGLAFTLALIGQRHLHVATWLHFGLAVAVAEAAQSLAGRPLPALGIKWPNDVVVVEPATGTFRKLCGILTETAPEADGDGTRVAIGVGVNVSHTEAEFPDELRNTATSLHIETGAPCPDRFDVLASVLRAAWRYWRSLAATGPEAIRAAVREHSVVTGREVDVTRPDGTIRGTVRGIDDAGRLVLTTPGGERIIDSGEVTALRPASS